MTSGPAGCRVGFIGLGRQGRPMAERILGAGIPLTVWARRPEAASELGAHVAVSAKDLGSRCDVVGLCVFDADDVRDVMFGPDGVLTGMRPGGVVAVHSTIAPDDIRSIAARAARNGVTVLDAPVSGGPAVAEAGQLLVIVAGDRAAAGRATPMFESYAGTIVEFPQVGMGQTVKLINNALQAAQLGLVADAARVAARFGVEDGLFAALRAGSARGCAVDMFADLGSMPVLARTPFPQTVGKDVAILHAALAGDELAGGTLLSAALAVATTTQRLATESTEQECTREGERQ